MKKSIIIVTGALCLMCCARTLAQEKGKELSLGDTIPDLSIGHLLLEPQTDLTMSDLYGNGLLLLNFWATWCGPCIDEMKKLGGYVANYPQLNVLSLTYENKNVIKQFLRKRTDIAVGNTHVLAEDTVFHQLFPHQALPHNVWVDQHGVVRAIGSYESVNEESIEKMLAGGFGHVTFKKDVPFDYFKYLNLDDSLLNFRAIFQPKLPGVNINGFVIDTYGKKKRFLGWNLNRTQLLWAAHYRQQLAYPNHELIEFNVADSTKYFWPEQDSLLFERTDYKSREDWINHNTYTYELIATGEMTRDEFYNRIVYDLNSNFGLASELALRNRECRIVTAGTGKQLAVYSPAEKGDYLIRIDSKNDELIIRNATIQQILSYITERTFRQGEQKNWRYEPFVDETGFEGLISCTIPLGNPTEYKNIHFWETLFSDFFGFQYSFGIRPYPVLIIEDF